MTDFRYLPPREGEEPPDLHTCQNCGGDFNFTTKVIVDALCSGCLVAANLPDGTVATRNRMREPEQVSASPEGIFSLIRNVQDFGQGLLPKTQPGGHHWNATLQTYVPDAPDTPIPDASQFKAQSPAYRPPARPGSRANYLYPNSVTYDRPPKLGDSPNYVYEYIQRHYSPEDIEDRYSAIKDELLYPKPAIKMTIVEDPNQPPDTATFVSGDSTVNLTGLSVSDTLDIEDEKPATEETKLRTVLSRDEADAAFKKAAAALAEIEALETKYAKDLSNGSVIAFRLTFPGLSTHFSYAAIKAVGQWFPTGKLHPDHPAGVGVDWSIMLACFEQFGATDFIVLREGGDQAELESGNDEKVPDGLTVRKAVVDPTRTDAFKQEPVIVSSRFDEPAPGSDKDNFLNEAPEQ